MKEENIRIADRIPSILCWPSRVDHEKRAAAKLPVVLLLHGFGSHKNEVGNMYEKLALALARNGIASLRIDFSGWGDSCDAMEHSSLDNMLSDATIAFDYLYSHERINPEQIAICGFSLGAYIGFRLAQYVEKNYDNACSALIMLSPSGNPSESFMRTLGCSTLDPSSKNTINTFDLGWREVRLGKCFFESLLNSPSLARLGSLNTNILAIAAKQDFSNEYLASIANASTSRRSRNISIEHSDHIFGIYSENDQSLFIIHSIIHWLTPIMAEKYCETKNSLNNQLSLSERVISDLLKKSDIVEEDLATDARRLQTHYSMAESIGSEHLQLDDTDVVVVLSGRSGFKGTYLEAANKHVLCPDTFDATDTLRRMIYGINIAKKCTYHNQLKGIKKPVYVYFNGVKRQNDELKNILQTEGSFYGYPANLIVVDSIPLDNTMGNVIGLSKYLDDHWLSFCNRWGLSRQPNIVFCTSSYHVRRVKLGVGSNSPLLTPAFWHSRPDLLDALPAEFKDYVLSPGNILRNSYIVVLGCDRQITANPFWEKDLYCDMQASVNYSSLHRMKTFHVQPLPSIASDTADNIVTLVKMNIKLSLLQCRGFHFFNSQTMEELTRKNAAKPNEDKSQTTFMC